eukprot:TRINITY_DN43439_c0_g1_i1.p1 TRINITY_DN43439_c0_g1~~TRINITY_DN43439_c0_g1_i1.p1  ORF type:complete len:384 (+),score=88.64 TRINITY_DN43439_c0_g1_i1:53-1204(+)
MGSLLWKAEKEPAAPSPVRSESHGTVPRPSYGAPPTCVTIPCPSNKVGVVIGTGGWRVQSLEEETGTRIQIDSRSENCTVTIHGAPDQIDDAKERILLLINPYFETIPCPPGKEGAVIGAQGATVKRIQQESGARVDLRQQGSSSVIVLTGSPAEVSAAKRQISAITKPPSVTLECPADAVGAFMGRGGENIQRLEQICGGGNYAETGIYVHIYLESSRGKHYVSIEASDPKVLSKCRATVESEIKAALKMADYEGQDGSRLRREAEKQYDSAKTLSGAARSDAFTRARELDARAAAAIFEYNNAGRQPNVIDLHGLRVDEAMSFLERRLSATRRGCEVEVITGAGHHSEGGLAKVKAAALAMAQERRYGCTPVDAGTLKMRV